MYEQESTIVGPSPFNEVGLLRAHLKRNLWDDTGGRPVVAGAVVAGDVIGLMQAIEDVPARVALELLRERFIRRSRSGVAAVLRELAGSVPASNPPLRKELTNLVFDVPFLRRVGIAPEVAEAWGVGWCPRGWLRGRIVFPIRRPDGTLVGYAGLDPTRREPGARWRFPKGFRPELELFAIHRLHREERVKTAAHERGIILADDPLEAVRMVQRMCLPVVSLLSAELSRAQIELLLEPAINPMDHVSVAGKGKHGRILAMKRHWWRHCADQPA
jgi:hypothetical protein